MQEETIILKNKNLQEAIIQLNNSFNDATDKLYYHTTEKYVFVHKNAGSLLLDNEVHFNNDINLINKFHKDLLK